MKPTTRVGKIAHLPHRLREDLNQRLHDGVPGYKILAWLNAEPDTQRILAEYYPGQRITQQNLSVWRQGGYQDWVNLQRANDLTLQLAQDPESIDLGIRPQKITESMATITAAEFVRAAEERSRACTTTDERWEHVCAVNTQLSRLRQDNNRIALANLQKEQWDYQVAADQRTTQKAAEAKVRAELLTELNHIMNSGRAELPLRPNVVPVPPAHPASSPSIGENSLENAHIPTRTNLNQAHPAECTRLPSIIDRAQECLSDENHRVPEIAAIETAAKPSADPISGEDHAGSVDARVPATSCTTVPGETPATTGQRPVPPTKSPTETPNASRRSLGEGGFPTNTNLNHAHNISLTTGRAELPLRPNIKTTTQQTQGTPSRHTHHQPIPHPVSDILHPVSPLIPTLDLSLPLPIAPFHLAIHNHTVGILGDRSGAI